MRCFEINRCGDAVFERVFPTRHAHAPLVARLEPGKTPFRMRCNQIVSIEHGEIEKLARRFYADCVHAEVFRTGAAKSVAIKSGHRIATTTFEISSEDVCRHEVKLANNYLFQLKIVACGSLNR